MNKSTLKRFFILSIALNILSRVYTAEETPIFPRAFNRAQISAYTKYQQNRLTRNVQENSLTYTLSISAIIAGISGIKWYTGGSIPASAGLLLWSKGFWDCNKGYNLGLPKKEPQAAHYIYTSQRIGNKAPWFSPGLKKRAAGTALVGIGSTLIVNNTEWDALNVTKAVAVGGAILYTAEGIRAFSAGDTFKKSNVYTHAAVSLAAPFIYNHLSQVFSTSQAVIRA